MRNRRQAVAILLTTTTVLISGLTWFENGVFAETPDRQTPDREINKSENPNAKRQDILVTITEIQNYGQVLRFQDKLYQLLPVTSEVFEKTVSHQKVEFIVRTSLPASEWAPKIVDWHLDPGTARVMGVESSALEVRFE